MKFLIKATECEQVKNAIPWELVMYDDEKGEIYTITEYEYIQPDDSRYQN